MSFIEDLVSSGRVVDVICLLMLAEAVAIILVYRRTGRGIPPAEALPSLLAGVGLLLALRGALTQTGWEWIALSLAAALLAHLADVAQRWRR